MVGDFDEGDAAVHAVVFAIEDHFAVDVFEACGVGGKRQGEFLGFETPRMVKSPSTSKELGAVCTILVERKVIVG